MQGFNMGRYRPPSSLDPALSTSVKGETKQTHPLGARARKLPQGVLIVRFEMPFAIWCGTCPSHSSSQLIGQGVRFNAEKKKVGAYFSTPVWSFRLKHTACGGWIEIRTDPKNSEYVVTEGATKRDKGDDEHVSAREGATVLLGEDEKKRLDAIETLEGKVDDKRKTKSEVQRLEEIRSMRDRDWKHADAQNSKLRASFRVGRKAREQSAHNAALLQDKMSLGIDIVDETDEDRRRASFVDFGQPLEYGGGEATSTAAAKPLFASAANSHQKDPPTKQNLLRESLQSNTRVTLDPFASSPAPKKTGSHRLLPGLKRKLPGS